MGAGGSMHPIFIPHLDERGQRLHRQGHCIPILLVILLRPAAAAATAPSTQPPPKQGPEALHQPGLHQRTVGGGGVGEEPVLVPRVWIDRARVGMIAETEDGAHICIFSGIIVSRTEPRSPFSPMAKCVLKSVSRNQGPACMHACMHAINTTH